MNPKQAVQFAPALATLATVAPPLLIGGAIGLGIVLLIKALSASDKDMQPETTPAKLEAELNRKPAENAGFRQIPAAIPAKPVPVVSAQPVPRPAPVRPVSLASVAVQPAVPVQAVTPVPKATPPTPPQPIVKKFIARADMAVIFENGKRALSRPAAVTALRRLGFGKSAAYTALSPDGRFSGWLTCAPDGIISWTDGQKI